jgi:hypothetical protein
MSELFLQPHHTHFGRNDLNVEVGGPGRHIDKFARRVDLDVLLAQKNDVGNYRPASERAAQFREGQPEPHRLGPAVQAFQES